MNFWNRSAGVLLHITSLPSPYGIGDLGPEAYRFVDFLNGSNQSLWQVFPLGPTGYGDSPYQSFSAFAGNPLLISFDLLMDRGFVDENELKDLKELPRDRVDFGPLIELKYKLLHLVYQRFVKRKKQLYNDFKAFVDKESWWLKDYSFFQALKKRFDGKVWNVWPESIKRRTPRGIDEYSKELTEEIEFENFLQFLFYSQWNDLKKYAKDKNVKIIGDLPIFVAYDSADVWGHPELFYLEPDGRPKYVAGVPPDYFSVTGQKWGNPHYRWDLMEERGFEWWTQRLSHLFKMVDYVRIDHFRGLEAYWEIPAEAPTAETGRWVKAPGDSLFKVVRDKLGELPIIAEDLGVITPEVEALRRKYEFPGMKIMQFGFDGENKFLPHNYSKNYVVFTGTHDNNTSIGWFNDAKEEHREFVLEYLNANKENFIDSFIRLAYGSVALFCVIPLQDLLHEGSQGRMNYPGKFGGNWQWRFEKGSLSEKLSEKLKGWVELYERGPVPY